MDTETPDDLQDPTDVVSADVASDSPPPSVMSALEGDSDHISSGETTAKQPRSLATIDELLVSRTQPAPEEELEDAFDYGAEKEDDVAVEDGLAVEEMGEDDDTEEVASAQQEVEEPDMLDSLAADKENDPDAGDNYREQRIAISQLPLSKIKKFMKMDPDTKLISNDSVLLMAYSTELFIKALATAAARYSPIIYFDRRDILVITYFIELSVYFN